MTRINDNAWKIGTVEFNNGNRSTLYIGANSNTGDAIMWQKVEGQRASRVTGKNINKLVNELQHVLNEGEAKWLTKDDRAVDYIRDNYAG